MAAVWNFEPIAGSGGAGGGDDDSVENGAIEMDLGDAGADGVADHDYDDGELAEDL